MGTPGPAAVVERRYGAQASRRSADTKRCSPHTAQADASMTNDLRIHAADATELTLEVAGLGSRSYAFIIDWHIRSLFALVWLLVAWLVMARGGGLGFFSKLFEDGGGAHDYRVYVTFLPALAIYFLYHPVLEIAMQGRTPGKRMACVRLVEAN